MVYTVCLAMLLLTQLKYYDHAHTTCLPYLETSGTKGLNVVKYSRKTSNFLKHSKWPKQEFIKVSKRLQVHSNRFSWYIIKCFCNSIGTTKVDNFYGSKLSICTNTFLCHSFFHSFSIKPYFKDMFRYFVYLSAGRRSRIAGCSIIEARWKWIFQRNVTVKYVVPVYITRVAAIVDWPH